MPSNCHLLGVTPQTAIVHPAADDAALRVLSRRAVAAWLLVCCGMIFAMVVIGGITRLTLSGLSITEWQPVSGILPPLSAAVWTAEFEPGADLAARRRGGDRARRVDDPRRRVCRRAQCRADLQHLSIDGRAVRAGGLCAAAAVRSQLVRKCRRGTVRPSSAGDDHRRRGAVVVALRIARRPAAPGPAC